ncbi:MAG TPA: ABC transporter substrate-binding protein [Stellaceae bacterium]|jgi:osmoprotectant transport system substrate-binding protein|nr:ABC transporter substrate-binding protein [Stellaceae bacterium]
MRAALALWAIIVTLALPAGAAIAGDAVRVASKIDTEGTLLGNLMLAVLEARGIKATDKLGLGPTNILRKAIIAGEIDLYPEYTGNGAIFYALESDPAWRSAADGYARINALDAARNLVWLAPAPADNAWAIALRKDVAQANGLASMEDFARWVNADGPVRLAASAEFVESPAALPAFERAYGFTLKRAQILTLAGGNTAVTLRAAAEGTSGVNAAMAYGTDGALAILDLVVMADPKKAQVVYAPAPVIRASVLERHPEIRDGLDPVFRSLDEATLRRLNAAVAVDGEDARHVALEYLRSKGFVR